jgi:glycosyltransferase involved in cell wall biosynthesis
MRVLAITNLYPNPYQSHRAPFNRHQLRLIGERHPMHVIAPIAWMDELRARRHGAARLPWSRRLELDGLMVDHPSYLYPPGVLRRCYGKLYLWSVRRTFRRVIREFRPTVILAPWAYPDGWAAVQLGREAALPVVIKVHGSDILLLPQFPCRRAGTEEAVRGADAVIAVSADLRERLIEIGVEPQRIGIVYDGVDTAMFHRGSKAEARQRVGLGDGEPVALFVGNLVPVKGIDVLLDACSVLKARNAPVRLTVIGSGPLQPMLEQQARRLGIANRITFLGSLPQQRIADWYRAADLFVLPSRSEGVPNVLLEASACGIPWIASRVGGIPEITHLGQSQLVPPNQPEALAHAMSEITALPTRGDRFVVRTRNDAAAEVEALLLSVEAANRPGSRPAVALEVIP